MLPFDQIQADVLRGFRYGEQLPFARYLFFKLGDAARPWLHALCSSRTITTVKDWDDAHGNLKTVASVAFTARGLIALGVDPAALKEFPPEFRAGMAERAAVLGDRGASAPEHWQFGAGARRIDALLTLTAVSAAECDAAEARVQQLTRGLPVELVHREVGAALPGGVEHFGYRDGIGQPAIDDSGLPPRPGEGTHGFWGWRPLKPGEFVLGYPTEQKDGPRCPTLGKNGSFLVFRKLEEDVAGFRALLARAADETGLRPELVGAKLIGRWKSGAPIELAPEADDPALGDDMQRANNFIYHDDVKGYRCPVGAHVRRANPRDVLDNPSDKVQLHRIIRRSLPYGPELPDGAEPDGEERGICFIAVCGHLDRQFEFVQQNWLNDGLSAKALADSRDAVTGAHQGVGHVVVNGEPPCLVGALQRLVTTRGGDYFFLPGIATIQALAECTPPLVWQKTPAALHAEPAAAADERLQADTGSSVNITSVYCALAAIAPGQVDDVRAILRKGEQLRAIEKVPTVHYARVGVFEGFHDEGQGEKPLKASYLFFNAVYDGEFVDFAASLRNTISQQPAFVWDHCLQYPGVADQASLEAWMRKTQVPLAFAYSIYPKATVTDVQHSLDFKRRFLRFAVAAQRLPAVALRDAYERFIREVEKDLT
jgi:Dyp-type peroxidase family